MNWTPKELKEHSKSWHLKITACKKRYKQTVNLCIFPCVLFENA